MKKFLLGLVLLLSTCPLFGQATNGFHRTATALARAFQGVTAQVVPNAKVTVTATATGLAATIYSDPALSSQITPAVVTADNSGNYGYYIPFGYMVTETITSPGQGTQVITNIGNNNSGAGTTFQTNGVNNFSQTLLNHVDTSTVKWTNPSGGVESATCTTATNSVIGCSRPDGTTITATAGVLSAQAVSGQLSMQSTPPTGATYIRVNPSGVVVAANDTQYVSVGNVTSGNVRDTGCTIGGCLGTGPAKVTWSFTLPSYVNPSNVTAVYGSATAESFAVGNNNGSGAVGLVECKQGISTFNLATSNGYGPFYALQQFNTLLTAVTGTQVSTVTCDAQVSNGSVVQNGLVVNVPAIYLQLADSIDTAPTDNSVRVVPPLNFNSSLNSLSLSYPLDVLIDTGAADAYVVSNPNLTTFPGISFKFLPTHASTSATPTLSLNGIPATNIVGPTGGALTSGDLSTLAEAIVVVGPNLKFWLQNPQVSGGGGGSVAFGSITSGTNTTAAMVVGNGASMAPTGTGTIQATNIANTITQGTNVTITGSGTTASPYNISSSGGGGGGSCPSGWVCITSTGTDWGTQCTSALSTLGSGGGVIYTGPGTYTMANNCAVNQNNISILGAGSEATIIDVTTSADGLTYQMTGTTVNNPLATATSFSGMRFLGNGTSGQIPIHFKDARGLNFSDLFVDHSGAASPCVEFENVVAWTEENRGSISFGAQCFAAVEMFQDSEVNLSFGYNDLQLFVQVGNGQNGLYIPNSGTISGMYSGSLTFFGDLSGTGTLINNQGMNIGGTAGSNIFVPTSINVQTEGSGGTIWSVSSSVQTIFVSPRGINTQSASQGTAYSVANLFYPQFPLPSLVKSNYWGAVTNAQSIDAFCPNLNNNGTCFAEIGVNNSSNNEIQMGLNYTSTGSSSNYGYAKLSGGTVGWKIDPSGNLYDPTLTNTPFVYTDANGKFQAGTLTTTGSSGAATLSGGTLNIPQYSGGGGGGGNVTNITGSSQVTATGCTQSASTGGTCAISGTSTAAVTLSVIPGSYLNLRLVIYGTSTAGTPNVTATYNSDSGTNYAVQGFFQQSSSAPTANQGVSQHGCVVTSMTTAMGAGDFRILGYADTNFWKTAFYNGGTFSSISSGTNNWAQMGPCAWNNTAAITSITLTIASGDFGDKTKFILYGEN